MHRLIRLTRGIGLHRVLRWASRTLNQLFFIRLIGATENFESVRWMRTRIAQNILDLWTIQETIADIKPRVIIECGTYEGGSAHFYASLFDLIGAGRIISIDIANRCRVTHPRIRFLLGSSVSPNIVAQVKEWIAGESPVMVILDSDHSAPHVLQEMELYGSLVTPGSFMLVQDGVIDLLSIFRAGRPGPLIAIQDFLNHHNEFEVDLARCNRFLITHHPMGWLRRQSEALPTGASNGAVSID